MSFFNQNFELVKITLTELINSAVLQFDQVSIVVYILSNAYCLLVRRFFDVVAPGEIVY